MVERPFAWLFNLDAEDELRHPGRHARSPQVQERIRSLLPALRDVVRPGDVVLDADDAGNDAALADHVAQPWCPTPTAVERLRRAGALLPAFPSVDVLRRVNHRAFSAALGQSLPGAAFVHSHAELLAHVAGFPEQAWLLKRPFSFSGRHRLRCRFPVSGQHETRWLEASFRHGEGLQVEPWVERLVDAVVHGYCHEDGTVRLGDVAVQECDEHGAWLTTRLATAQEIGPAQTRALLASAFTVARALRDAGYFGPFGMDAFQWRTTQGEAHWNLRSEINARYTMGWHIGMGGWRPQPTVRDTV